MNVIHLPDRDLPTLGKGLLALEGAGAKSVQLLGAVGNGWQPEELDPLIAGLGIPVFGGLFPSVIFEGRACDAGAVLIGHHARTRITVVDISGALPAAHDLTQGLDGSDTIVAYLDATCPSGPLMRALFDARGARTTWCGGGAGALDFVRRPVVITPAGLRAGVAVMAGLDATTTLGVTHGWKPFGNPLLVTESRGNDILTLDWRPAFDVYREAVEQRSSRRFAESDFFDLASCHPLMIERFGAEGVVRDPLCALDGGAIRCAGDVPQHSTVRVATGTFEDMVSAASRAREQATATRDQREPGLALTIDCISRALLLRDHLHRELQALRVDGVPQAGALTIGEIASSPDHFLQMHNKTTVLAMIAVVSQGP
jgi:hypothetical protein